MIQDGDTIIIKMHDEQGAMLTVSTKTEQKIGKTKVFAS